MDERECPLIRWKCEEHYHFGVFCWYFPPIQSNSTFILTGTRRLLSLPPTLPRPPPTAFKIHHLPSLYLVQRTRHSTQTTPRNPNTVQPASLRIKHPSLLIRKRENLPPPLHPSQNPPKSSQHHPNPPIPPNNRRHLHLPHAPQILR